LFFIELILLLIATSSTRLESSTMLVVFIVGLIYSISATAVLLIIKGKRKRQDKLRDLTILIHLLTDNLFMVYLCACFYLISIEISKTVMSSNALIWGILMVFVAINSIYVLVITMKFPPKGILVYYNENNSLRDGNTFFIRQVSFSFAIILIIGFLGTAIGSREFFGSILLIMATTVSCFALGLVSHTFLILVRNPNIV
jgi:uncharacterized membrane protein (GlpM family)